MTLMRRFIASSFVCGVFAAGCVSSPATQDNAAAVGEAEQELGATTQAQERLITYFAEAAHINVVGSCFGPYRCFGPKGTTCWGIKTAFYEIDWFDCDTP